MNGRVRLRAAQPYRRRLEALELFGDEPLRRSLSLLTSIGLRLEFRGAIKNNLLLPA